MKNGLGAACALLLLFAALPGSGQEIGREIAYTGFLTDSAGQALNGNYSMSFALYQAEKTGLPTTEVSSDTGKVKITLSGKSYVHVIPTLR